MKTDNLSYIKADAITASQILILKHTPYLRITNQIRTLYYYAKTEHKHLRLIIPYNCELSIELRYFINKHNVDFKISRET